MISESTQERIGPDGQQPAPAESVGSLVGEIVADSQRLVKQHLELFRREVREDFRKSKRAAVTMVMSYVIGQIGGLLLGAMLVGLLAWAVPGVAWWAWAGILGGIAVLTAFAMCEASKKMFASFNPLPDETAKAIKEDIKWLKN